MYFEIRPGFNQPIERFESDNEVAVARRWSEVCGRHGSAAWTISDTGLREGTSPLKDLVRAGLYEMTCGTCRKVFSAYDSYATTCPVCVVMESPNIPYVEPPPPTYWDVRSARRGVHVAGPRAEDQYCSRCGDLLGSLRSQGCGKPIPKPGTVPFANYPEGAFIERGQLGWQAMSLAARAPTCSPFDPSEPHQFSEPQL